MVYVAVLGKGLWVSKVLEGPTCTFGFEVPLLRAAGIVRVSGTPVVGLIGLTEGSSHVVPMETSHMKYDRGSVGAHCKNKLQGTPQSIPSL